ncbi:receptor protein kinase-like protein ZAR1 isoform X1 [Argentina anserina]|uniref:receptor protein kinase-like protein ZAR1 isoform X1 n=1 Tax=Argentina anserina TaxID=57926 RepID=UPI002176399B|nr:receptor protein kinase-like protein ZAR1 isoform X1 [Potentilla anserina]
MVLQVLLLVLLVSNSLAFVSRVNEEGLALISFKESLTEYAEGSLNNWNSSDQSPCSWDGVTCKQEKVVSLSLPYTNLAGILPPALGNLSALRRLNLRNNRLFGRLPSELFNAKELQSVVLSGNSLSGSVPDEIQMLTYLQTLDLSQNSFNNSIPLSIVGCRRLKSLVLAGNHFSGSLPDGITSLVSLQKLNISFNRFSGSIPKGISNLSNLRATLDMSHNLFNGAIPASLGNLPKRVYIDLSYNNLSGPIPQVGSLINQGPTAFVGNIFLCGPSIQISCHSSTPDSNFQFMLYNPPHNSGWRSNSSTCAVVFVIAGIILGICLSAQLLSKWYKKICSCKVSQHFEQTLMPTKDLLCFSRHGSESPEHYQFVQLDMHVNLDLDKLLKASAFLLGKSKVGIVYKVVLKDGRTLAVRSLGDEASQMFKEFQTEIEAIGKMRHPNITTLLAYYWSIDEKLLIYEYIPNGDLSTAIHGKPGMISFKPLSWPIRLRIMIGMAKGLAYIHEHSPRKYVHGDLRPRNVLLGPKMDPHISNFRLGRLAKVTEESESFQFEQLTANTSSLQKSPYLQRAASSIAAAEPCYKAPEATKVAKSSQKGDVFSFGVIMMEMISAKKPYIRAGSLEIDLVEWFKTSTEEPKVVFDVLDQLLAPDVDMEEEIVAVMKIALACVAKAPERRPSMRCVCDNLARLA